MMGVVLWCVSGVLVLQARSPPAMSFAGRWSPGDHQEERKQERLGIHLHKITTVENNE